jgi:hypothetical protein
MHQSLGDGVPKRGLPPRHPAHRTRTVDYAIVMSGEMDMLLDDLEVHLRSVTCCAARHQPRRESRHRALPHRLRPDRLQEP